MTNDKTNEKIGLRIEGIRSRDTHKFDKVNPQSEIRNRQIEWFWNCTRNSFLSNFPTLVLGTDSINTTSSGSHQRATRGRRNWSTSSLVSVPLNCGLGTTQAKGRSCHFGCGTAITAASRTRGCGMMATSRYKTRYHS